MSAIESPQHHRHYNQTKQRGNQRRDLLRVYANRLPAHIGTHQDVAHAHTYQCDYQVLGISPVQQPSDSCRQSGPFEHIRMPGQFLRHARHYEYQQSKPRLFLSQQGLQDRYLLLNLELLAHLVFLALLCLL